MPKIDGRAEQTPFFNLLQILNELRTTIMANTRPFFICVVAITGLMFSICEIGISQDKPAPIPPEKLAEGWDEVDDRLVFLVIRLANTESSLEAIEKAIEAATRKRTGKLTESKRADKKNEGMDRKGGGPLHWSEFYGRTADSFFYHPTERKKTYHTDSVLGQSTEVVQISSRPPQFDYIYRANEKAKARAEAEAAEIQGGIQSLIERRTRLEAEQAGLWVEIAFRAVQHFDLDKKPLFRFEPISEVRENAEAMRAAASFMATALSLVNEADDDQSGTFSRIKPTISKARQELNDTWLRLGIESPGRQTNLGRFAALAKRLNDVASNLSDSYLVAVEGAQAKDQQRKETFRGTLQTSLISYAQIILALDEMSTLLKDEWKTKPALDKPLQFVGSKQIVVIPPERTDQGYPIIRGVWQEVPGVLVKIIQQGEGFTASTVYLLEKTEIRWIAEGTISKDGRIEATVLHTMGAPGAKPQKRTAQLSADKKSIKGIAAWDGGGHEFSWTTQEAGQYPRVDGIWQEAPGITFDIVQLGDQFIATVSFMDKKAGEIRAISEGTITKDGKIVAKLFHTKAPSTWKKEQKRTGQLSADGNSIIGVAVWDGGGQEFTWTRKK